jgi:ubiquinone/menaquinone biosynthesis C-methylase UbiE
MMRETFVSNGDHYDSYNASVRADLSFWVRRARESGGPVLELGCGTGRIAIPMAERHVVVSGLDTSESFLMRAKKKAGLRGLDIAFHCGDMRSFQIAQKFQLIAIPFRGVAALLSYAELCSCFRCARAHMLPNASFVVDTFNTPDNTYSRQASQPSTYRDPSSGQPIEVTADSQYDCTSRIVEIAYTFRRPALPDVVDKLTLRHHRSTEMMAALEEAQLVVTDHLGDYDERPCTIESPTQILIAQRT